MRVYTQGNVRSSGAAPSSPDTHTLTSTLLVLALTMAGTGEAARAGNRLIESQLAVLLSRLEAEHGDPLAALDYITLAIRNFHDSATRVHPLPPGNACRYFHRLRRLESAATIGGFAFSPLATLSVPEFTTAAAHLRDVLGDQTYESLARTGETMTTAEMATYAYDQIDQARAELNTVSK